MTDPGEVSPPNGPDDGALPLDLPSARHHTALYVSLAFGGLLIGLLVLLASRIDDEPGTVRSPLIGEQAPSIVATDMAGGEFDIDDHRGRWVVVNFFATWCVECVREHPELVAFDERHRGRGDAQVVSIAFDDSGGAVADFFTKAGGDWPVLVADTGTIALDWSVAQVPETYLVSPAGQVVGKFIGGVTADGLDRAINNAGGGS
ncbi:MAG: TlpA family protein disulfide reductase [Acidimicrobiales bacterium]|nr:TlpA family protein disulfide reductase [Acidimicrobiales bacterium]